MVGIDTAAHVAFSAAREAAGPEPLVLGFSETPRLADMGRELMAVYAGSMEPEMLPIMDAVFASIAEHGAAGYLTVTDADDGRHMRVSGIYTPGLMVPQMAVMPWIMYNAVRAMSAPSRPAVRAMPIAPAPTVPATP